MDWVATFLKAADVAPHRDFPLDGIDLLGPEGERPLYWRMKFRSQKAMRSSNWKYLSIEGHEYLFDLSKDARERANVKHREPARFSELREQYGRWEEAMPAIPSDAKVSLVYGAAEMPQASS